MTDYSHRIRRLVVKALIAVAALAVALVANIVLLNLATSVPLCPSRYVAYIIGQPYCTSYRWEVAHLAVVQSLYFVSIWGVTRAWPRLRSLLAQVPLVLVFLVLVELTQQARDSVAPQSAEKVEFQSNLDLPVTWGLAVVAVVLLEWALVRRRGR